VFPAPSDVEFNRLPLLTNAGMYLVDTPQVRSSSAHRTVLEQFVAVGDEVVVREGVHLSGDISVWPRVKIPYGAEIPRGAEVRDSNDVLRYLLGPNPSATIEADRADGLSSGSGGKAETVFAGYLEHLSGHDLSSLLEAGGLQGAVPEEDVRRLRIDPSLVERLLADPAVYEALFGPRAPADPFVVASPFLVFAVIVLRSAARLAGATFVEEWVGPRRRLPVFDVEPLRHFLEDPRRRLFLIELLASYTRVASGAVMVRSRKGLRRHRFSELDPVRFASLLEMVPEEERPGIYRRLGDLCLFLTGVFPDRSATWRLGPIDRHRLLRASVGEGDRAEGAQEGTPGEDLGMLALLEELGQRWYRLACSTAPFPAISSLAVVQSVADRFRVARRVLNFITDHYLFPRRAQWFTGSAG
jgi:hypothetical protein